MNVQTDLCDDKFVPFLHSLGIETYKKSFEWMLNEPEYSGILLWLYENLDHNNALTPREEYRYIELKKTEKLLSEEDLQSTISAIQEDHPGMVLPGDQESLEDIKEDICMLQERLHLLEKQEAIVQELISQNEIIKEELNVEITTLNSTYHQYSEDEKTAADECLRLARQVETTTECVVDLIADTLDVYGNCHIDMEMAKKFLNFGPLDSYKQSQALFCSHFDLYVSKKFKRQHDFDDKDMKAALFEARSMEDRLTDALWAYIDSKADLAGEQARLALVDNYVHPHPTQIPVLFTEVLTSIDLIDQEQSILRQQMETAVKDLVSSRTKLAVETVTRSAFTVREQIQTDIVHLLEVCHQALALDRIMYYALRDELRTVEDLVQFAAQLRQYVVGENEAVACRIDSMNAICLEQNTCEAKLLSCDPLTQALTTILGSSQTEPGVLVKLYNDLVGEVGSLYRDVKEGCWKKEERLKEFKSSLQVLNSYIFDGCTKQPNSRDRIVASLTHSLRNEMERVEKHVLQVGGMFTAAKNADKHNLRKLWQWFLTDETRFLTAMKGPRS